MLLLACERCARQYDVTELVPGTPIRCACDALLWVGVAGAATRMLACAHCGGALARDRTHCSYCEREVDWRRGTLCPSCFARVEDDSRHCRHCGVAIAPQALAPVPADRACPRCGGALALRVLPEVCAVECGSCGGFWLDAEPFQRVQARARAGEALPIPGGGGPPARERYIPCLRCGQLMVRRQFRRGERLSGVVVDACRECGVWLDRDELPRILAFLSGDVSSAP